jgi:peptidoglycan/xylan/chitin deacetylase (PgdA/CDA1 family)
LETENARARAQRGRALTWPRRRLPILLFAGALSLAAQAERSRTLGVFGDRSPEVLYSVQTDEPVIAITIDDGPDAATTPRLLQLLDAYEAKATFFLIADRVQGNESLVRAMVKAGHEIGNHMTRDVPSIELAPDVFEQELLRADRILSPFARPRWFRPGSGWYDEIMLEILERHGYQAALGTIYPLDAHVGWSWFAQRYILTLANPGSVIILHDGGGRGERTLATLQAILPELIDDGYRLVTLSELVGFATGALIDDPPDAGTEDRQ